MRQITLDLIDADGDEVRVYLRWSRVDGAEWDWSMPGHGDRFTPIYRQWTGKTISYLHPLIPVIEAAFAALREGKT